MNKISNPLVHIGLIIVLMVGFVYTPDSSSQDKRMLETDWSKHLAETVIHEEFGEYVLEDILPDRSRADNTSGTAPDSIRDSSCKSETNL